MILYKLSKSNIGFIIAKFDDDFNVESVYELTHSSCSCPRGKAPTCRHRQMLPAMLDKVDTEWFYCFEDRTWHQPFGPANSFGETETTMAPEAPLPVEPEEKEVVVVTAPPPSSNLRRFGL